MKSSTPPNRSSGFTLVELLVVIAIIGILIGMLLPAVQQVREAARRSKCANTLKQLGLACHNYESAYMRLPPGGSNLAPPFGSGAKSPGGHSWMAYSLPYLEQQTLWDAADFDNNVYTGMMNVLSNQLIPSFKCPSSPMPEFTLNVGTFAMISDYVAISGNVGGFGEIEGPTESTAPFNSTFGIIAQNGVFYNNSETGFGDIYDGSSNTMMISEVGDFVFVGQAESRDYRPGGRGETETQNGPGFHAGWQTNTNPDQLYNCTTLRYLINPGESLTFSTGFDDGVQFRGYNAPLRSAHPGGVQIVLGDASVQFVSDSVSTTTLAQLANRDDGLPLGDY